MREESEKKTEKKISNLAEWTSSKFLSGITFALFQYVL